MPKKSSGKSARGRVAHPSRPPSRPAAVVPVDRTTMSPAPPSAVTTPAAASAARPVSAAARAPRPLRTGSLIPITDYRYVMSDLRRIALLAGAALLVLVGLTFVIHSS